MGESRTALTAQRLLLASLVAVMLLSACLLWMLRAGTERGRKALAPSAGMEAEASAALEAARASTIPSAGGPEHGEERTQVPVLSEAAPAAEVEAFDPGAIRGRVLSHGEPVPEVELRLFDGRLERGERRSPQAEARSDAEGCFAFRGLAPFARYTLRLQHKDFLPKEETVFPGHAEELELEPSATVAGTVRSAASGQPLAGVEVALERWHSSASGPAERVSSTSDAEGRWQLAWAEPGIERFLVLRPGYLPERREFQVAPQGGEGYEILLGSERALELEPYALESGAALPDTELLSDDARVRTDARGRLSVPLVPAAPDESLRVSLAFDEGCLTQGRLTPTDGLTPLASLVRVPLTRGGTVHGRVLDADGRPVSGAQVRMQGGGRLPPGLGLPEGFWLNPARNSVRSALDGSFRLVGLPPREGEVDVRAQHPDHPPGRCEPFAFALLGAEVELEIRLARGATLAGTVRVDGEPAALRVYWSSERASGWTRANDRGDYRIGGVPAGSLSLRARLEDEDDEVPRAEDQTLLVAEGEHATVDFELASNRAFIRGRVLDTRGAPVAEAEVLAQPGQDEEWLGEEPRAESDAEGRFELAVPARPGLAFDVWAESGPRRVMAPAVPAGAHDVELVLPALTEVVLRVVDQLQHEPVAGFQLYWRQAEEGGYERLRQHGRRLSPGPDGTFRAELPSGRLDLVVCARALGFAPAQRKGVDLFGDGPLALEFELERGVELELELQAAPEAAGALQQLQRGRAAIASEEQWAERERGGDYFQQEVRAAQAVRVDANGVARLTALASGRYRFFNVPKGLVFEPRAFELPPVAHHRLSARLAPEEKKKPEDGGH